MASKTDTQSELFEHNEMVLPVPPGRDDLKILVSPGGSESSGISSLDAEDKVCCSIIL